MLEECPMNLEKSSEKEQNAPEKIDYEKFVIRKALSEYWRAEEKVEIVMLGMTCRYP
jgi:hypothetical protein